jgi:glycosyltransferase involved in cell wall biosynthesis
LVRLRRAVLAFRPEVIHSYSFYTNFAAWFAAVGRPVIAIGSLRNDYWADRRADGLLKGMLGSRFPGYLIANSENAQRQASAHCSTTAPRVVEFVPNGIDLERYPTAPLPRCARFEIVGVGRQYPHKAWDDLLRAMAKLQMKMARPWRLRLCGDGPSRAMLQSLSVNLGIDRQVEFLGYCDNVQAVLASSHVLVLPSHYEGTPNVVLEALSVGRPVVATGVGDVPIIVRDGREGFLVPVGDAQAMADRLERLANDSRLLEEMSGQARRRVESDFSLAALVNRTFAVYRRAGWRD